nr:unnamed protein product [Callosobruchus chinensis]
MFDISDYDEEVLVLATIVEAEEQEQKAKKKKKLWQQAINEVIVQEKQTLLEEIKDLKREIFNKKGTICTLQKTLDNLPINKLLMNVQTQTDNDRSQEVNATLRDDIAKMEEKNKQLRQDINRYIKQIEEMNKQQDELKQLARSMFTTTTVENTEEDKYTKEVNMLQTRTSGSCPETINQSAKYLMEDCGGTSGVQSMIHQDTSEQHVYNHLTEKLSESLHYISNCFKGATIVTCGDFNVNFLCSSRYLTNLNP